MKKFVVISGKGGTGKTVLTASMAVLAKNKIMVDCDVDAADLHLLLNPEIIETHDFTGVRKAVINQAGCDRCGRCVPICRFDAISSVVGTSSLSREDIQKEKFEIDPISCEGCGICVLVCPAHAIRMEENIAGKWFVSHTEYGPFVHAKLGIAEENSGKLVAKIRQVAEGIAEKEKLDYIIIDGPPGIGCPVIASLSGADLALIVTEPTLSGIHDMERVMDVAKHFSVPAKVIINKFDINPHNSAVIDKVCRKRSIPVLGRLPFSQKIVEAMIRGLPVAACRRDPIARKISMLWNKIASS